MPPPSFRGRLLRAATFAAAILIAAAPSRAADAPVLLVVPAGSDVARVEAARASVPRSRALLIVGATERIPLKEGMDLVADRSFSDAPPSDLVVVLAGEAVGAEEFLAARRSTAKAILFLGDSPLVKRLKGDGSRGALILVGGPEAVKALAGGETDSVPGAALGTPATPSAISHPTPPSMSPTRVSTPAEGAVRRYFSAKRVTPTPVPAATPGPER